MNMKRLIAVYLTAAMMLFALAGCGSPAEPAPKENEAAASAGTGAPMPSEKIRVDFEGVVTGINGSVLTLEDGRTVTLTENTRFSYSGQADGQGKVSYNGVHAGDFVQGAAVDPYAEQIAASTVFVIPGE